MTKQPLYHVTNVGFAGELFQHYIDGDFSRPASFATLSEAIEVAKTLRRGVVLFGSQSVWSYRD
jgi:hypothetical protein